jgi:hypothetical protein
VIVAVGFHRAAGRSNAHTKVKITPEDDGGDRAGAAAQHGADGEGGHGGDGEHCRGADDHAPASRSQRSSLRPITPHEAGCAAAQTALIRP